MNKIRDVSLDYIKTIAMIMIIITHLPWNTLERNNYLFPFWIDLAVPLLMIVTGINWYNSAKRNGKFKRNIPRYLKRILFLYFIVALIEFLILIVKGDNVNEILFNLLIGGYGPGSYYTFIMIQLILIFQIIYDITTQYRFESLF